VTRLTSPCHILDKSLANVLLEDHLTPDAAPAVAGMAAAVQKQPGSASRAAYGSPGAIQRGATMRRFAMAGAVVPARGEG